MVTMKYAAAMIIALILLASCTSQTENNDEIVIGAILHLSGNTYSYTGNAMREGIDIAVNEINTKGGINGKKIRVLYEDDGDGDNLKATTAAKKMIEVDHVNAAFVESYMQGMAIGPMFEQAHIPLIVLWDANEDLDSIGQYVFSTGPWTKSAGERLADFAVDDLKLKNVVVVHHATEWSSLIAKFFSEKFTSKGGIILDTEVVQPDTQDFRSVILKVMDKHPDAIYAPLEFEAGLFFKQIKEAGYSGTIMSSDQINLQIIENAQGGAEGLYYTLFLPREDNPSYQELKQKYITAYDKEPDQLLYNGFGYEGIAAVIAAMEKKGTSSEQIKDGLYALDGEPGAFGPLKFTSGGSTIKLEDVYQVQNSKEVFVKNHR